MTQIPDRCERCGEVLKTERIVWLELDQRNNTYHVFNDVPEDWSQGWFAFGRACAKRQIAEATKARP